MRNNLPRIFISYSRDNSEAAKILRRRVESADFSIWQDITETTPGLDWWQEVERAVDTCEYMLIVLTRVALESKTCQREWRYARQVGTQLIPILAEDLDFAELPQWMQRLDIVDPANVERWKRFLNVLATPARKMRVPQLFEPPPANFVTRSAEFDNLVNLLIDEKSGGAPIALKGAGGFGKTTLIQAVCQAEEVQSSFYDGVLWVTLGENPGDVTAQIADLIEAISGVRPGFETEEIAGRAFADLLRDRRCLIVIDDLWRRGDADLLLQGGKDCVRLISTRIADVLPEDTILLQIGGMTGSEAATMIGRGIEIEDPTILDHLVDRLGYWPLALRLANSYLRAQLRPGLPVADAVRRAEDRLFRRGVDAFNYRDTKLRNDTASKCILASVDLLKAREREGFLRLVVFSATASVPLQTLIRYLNSSVGMDDIDADNLVERLDDLSLLRGLNRATGQAQMHTVLLSWLDQQISAEDKRGFHGVLGKVLLEELAIGGGRDASYYLLKNLAYHLVEGDKHDQLDGLLQDYNWLSLKLLKAELPSLLEDFQKTAAHETHLIGETLRLAGHIITRDIDELASQLISRLEAKDYPELCSVATAALKRPALLTVWPSLARAQNGLLQTMNGHDDRVTIVRALPEGKAISASDDGSICHWDLATGRCLTTLSGHSGGITGLLTSGRDRAISSSRDGSVRVWSLPDRMCLHVFEGNDEAIVSIHPIPGNRVLACAADGDMHVLNLAHMRSEHVLRGHEEAVSAIVLLASESSGPESRLFSAGKDGRVASWDLLTGQCLSFDQIHDGAITDLVPLPGDRLLTLSEDHLLRVIDARTGSATTLTGHTDWVRSAVVIDDQTVASASYDGTIRIWNLQTGASLRTLIGHSMWVQQIGFLGGDRLVSSSDDRTLRIWDLRNGECLNILTGHSRQIRGFKILDDRFLISWSYDGSIRHWDTESGQCLTVFSGHSECVRQVDVTPQGNIISCSEDRSVRFWEFSRSSKAIGSDTHDDAVLDIKFVKGGRFVSASDDATLRVWSSQTGEVLEILRGHERAVRTIVSVGDYQVVSASDDGVIKCWDVRSGRNLRSIDAHFEQISGITPCQSAGGFYSFSGDRVIKRWDLEKADAVACYIGHEDQVTCLVDLGPSTFISGSRDCWLRRWDVDSGRCLSNLVGHSDEIMTLIRIGDLIISGSADHTIRVWSGESDRCKMVLTGHAGTVNCLAAVGTSTFLSGSADGTIRQWNLASGGCEMVYRGHRDRLNAISVLGEGLFISVSDDCTLRLWKHGNASHITAWQGDAPLLCVAAAGSKLFAIGDAKGSVHLIRMLDAVFARD